MATLHLKDLHAVHSARSLKAELEQTIQFFSQLNLANPSDVVPMRLHLKSLTKLQQILHLAIANHAQDIAQRVENVKEKERRALRDRKKG